MFDTYSEIFNERASAYHSAMQFAPAARDAEFRAVLEPIAGAGGTVCDIPAGGCYLARYLPADTRYIGVEPVEEFLEFGAAAGRTTINAAITDVPLADGSVDHVISLAGLHHEEELAPVFREMRRLVKPGGRIVMADVAAGTPSAAFLNGFVARHNPLGHEGRFLDDQTVPTLERAGLAVISDELVQVPWLFSSYGEAGEFCADLFGITGLSPEAVSEALAREIGLDADESGIRLRWVLRRIACEVP